MRNFKQDLINDLVLEKDEFEMKLIQTYENVSIPYRKKIKNCAFFLKKLALNDLKLQLANHYFQEKNDTNENNDSNESFKKNINGQSHNE